MPSPRPAVGISPTAAPIDARPWEAITDFRSGRQSLTAIKRRGIIEICWGGWIRTTLPDPEQVTKIPP